VVRTGVHQDLDLGEGCERGVPSAIVVGGPERAEVNHRSSWLGEGVSGGRGTSQILSFFVSLGQSASCQRGLGLSLWGEGGRRRS